MNIGKEINFIHNGKGYVGYFLEEQPNLFNEDDVQYRVYIENKNSRKELGLKKPESFLINKNQIFNDRISRDKALLKNPIKINEQIKEEAKEFLGNNNQIDLFEQVISYKRKMRR